MKQIFVFAFFLLLFLPCIGAQRFPGIMDSTTVAVSASEEFVLGKHTLYKHQLPGGSLQPVQNFRTRMQADTLFNEENHFLMDFAFTDPSHLWVVYGNYLRPAALLESKDGGQTWTERSDLYTYPGFPHLKRAQAIKYYGGKLYFFQDYYSTGIYQSDDSGASWNLFVRGGSACFYLDLGFCENGDIYAYSAATDGRGVHVVRVNGVQSPYSYNLSFDRDAVGMLYRGDPRWDSINYVCARLLSDSLCTLLPMGHPENAPVPPVTLYPNPAEDRVFFANLSAGQLHTAYVYDAGGTVALVSSVIPEAGLDISGLKPGLYVVRLQNMKGGIPAQSRFVRARP